MSAEDTPVGGDVEEVDESVCPTCQEEVDGPCVKACNRNFHPDCFVCGLCKQPFPGGSFFEHNGLPYCENDFYENYGPRCHKCKEVIRGKCITAMEVKWHKEHFVCFECNKALAGGSFIEVDGEAHCKPCAKAKKKKVVEVVGDICARCKLVIEGESITLQGQKMHPHHFTCHKCKSAFKQGVSCHEYEGRLYCDPHYKELLSAQCAQCRKPITGRAITALGKQWHPEHFVCAQCEQPFGGNNYMVEGEKPYCEADWVTLFGRICGYCEKQIGDGAVSTELSDNVMYQFHPEHFRCIQCDVVLGKNPYRAYEGKPICTKCYGKLPKVTKDRISQIIQAKKKAAKKK